MLRGAFQVEGHTLNLKSGRKAFIEAALPLFLLIL